MLNRAALSISTKIMERVPDLRYDRTVYIYGVEIILSTLLEIISILVSAIFLSSFIKGIVFIVVFFTLRIFAGGYHAETYKKCFCITCGVFLAVLLIANIVLKLSDEKILWVLLYLAITYIIVRAPVLNKNQPLSKSEIVNNVKLTTIFGVGYIFICIGFLQYNKELLSMTICTICSVAVLMLITDIIKSEGGKKEYGIHC